MELANLYVELGVATAFLRDVERPFPTKHAESAREQIAVLEKEIGEHRGTPWRS